MKLFRQNLSSCLTILRVTSPSGKVEDRLGGKAMPIPRHFQTISPRSFVILSVVAALGLWAIKATLAANGAVAYTYDALGRVTTARYDTGVCVIYTYDANGNRLSETVNVSTGSTGVWNTGVWGCFNWTQAP
jgi:YD repeat-containing protein